jgi:hypothetical protein
MLNNAGITGHRYVATFINKYGNKLASKIPGGGPEGGTGSWDWNGGF